MNAKMQAWCVREENHGNPLQAMKLEEVPVPKPGPGEVIIQIKAAGINFNHIWACKGIPVPISRLHPGEPLHIGGSDASGVVVEVGVGVKNVRVGDEVVTHPNQTCGQCSACNGFEPLSCLFQKAWGFETTWGSFAEYAKVQAQQLMPKPQNLSWEEAACYGLKFFTAYRMLIVQGHILPNDRVLIWGAAGGLGSYAIQLCKSVNATPICVISSPQKAEYCRSLGAELIIDRQEFDFLTHPPAGNVPLESLRKFRKKIREATQGFDPDVVFEHSGKDTFEASVFVTRRLGKIVICGATSGYQLSFDARYLWMHQKQILGSHGCNAHDAARANHLIEKKIIKPTLTRTFKFSEAAQAHELLLQGNHVGSWAIRVAA